MSEYSKKRPSTVHPGPTEHCKPQNKPKASNQAEGNIYLLRLTRRGCTQKGDETGKQGGKTNA